MLEGPISAGLVCGAFALELWLKALYCATRSGPALPTDHDLSRLFALLPIDLQHSLAQDSGYGSERLDASLQMNARVFTSWRYSYEHRAGNAEPGPPLEADVRLFFALGDACDRAFIRLRRIDEAQA